jgi:hypothetical protein
MLANHAEHFKEAKSLKLSRQEEFKSIEITAQS